MNHDQIHQRALKIVNDFRRCEFQLLSILEEAWVAKTFYHFKCSSLFKYSVDKLGLSPELTSIYTKIAKKTLLVSGFKEEIRSGRITISKANRICSVITEENKGHWFQVAYGSKRDLEKEVARASPSQAIREKAKIRSIENEIRIEITHGATEEHYENLKRSQDLLSQKLGRGASMEEAYEESLEISLQKTDPLRKANRARAQESQGEGAGSGEGRVRRPLTTNEKRQVHQKTRGQCSHIDESGARCQERRHLDIHHIKHVSEGGTNTLDNLTILCSGHHQMLHRQGRKDH